MTRRLLAAEVESIVRGEHGNPHDFLGHHGGLVRVWRPGAASVTVGRAKAEKIWFRALGVYMVSSTNYAGARAATLNASKDLYGLNSTEYKPVAAAWSAVNVN